MKNLEITIARIQEAVKKKGVTTSQMLTELGYSVSLLTDMKRKDSMPSADKIAEIAGYLGVDINYLLGKTDSPTPVPSLYGLSTDDPEDAIFFRVMKDAKESGISAHDVELAVDFLKRARERDQKLREQN